MSPVHHCVDASSTVDMCADLPRLVVLPGAGGVVLTPALHLLGERFNVFPLELPGFGDEPNHAADFDELAAQVLAQIDELQFGQFHLLGTSFGGAAALHLATLAPQRLLSLVLEAPAEQRINGRHPSTMNAEEITAAFRTHPEREPAFVPGPPPGGAHCWQLIDRLMGDGTLSASFQDRLRSCTVRTLVLFGTDDGVIPPVNGQIYRRLLPNCSLQYVFDAAHDIQSDRPEAFADVVGDFLDRGMSFLVNNTDALINP